MSDLISRQALCEYALNQKDKSITPNDIMRFPPAQRWIPCSERLPKEDVEVLVTDDAGGITTIDVDRCGMYEDTKERFWYTSQNVIAWMPLPEPYKEGIDDYKNM